MGGRAAICVCVCVEGVALLGAAGQRGGATREGQACPVAAAAAVSGWRRPTSAVLRALALARAQFHLLHADRCDKLTVSLSPPLLPSHPSPADLDCYNIEFKDATADIVLARWGSGGAGARHIIGTPSRVIAAALAAAAATAAGERSPTCPPLPPPLPPLLLLARSPAHPSPRPPHPPPRGLPPRLDEFSGDMLGHLLRAFGDMNYYDDELLVGWGRGTAAVLLLYCCWYC